MWSSSRMSYLLPGGHLDRHVINFCRSESAFGGPNFFDNSIYSMNLQHASRKGTC